MIASILHYTPSLPEPEHPKTIYELYLERIRYKDPTKQPLYNELLHLNDKPPTLLAYPKNRYYKQTHTPITYQYLKSQGL